MTCISIPFEIVKEITGAESDNLAAMQGRAVIGMLEAYLGVILIKRNFKNEKITVPYAKSHIFKAKHGPINSISELVMTAGDTDYSVPLDKVSFDSRYVEVKGKLPAHISALKMTYNAGLYDSWYDMPEVLLQAAEELLGYKYAADYKAGFTSEHLGDYSYSKGAMLRGLPIEIAGMLDGLVL